MQSKDISSIIAEKVAGLHSALTEAHPSSVEGLPFDAWYTKREAVCEYIWRSGTEIAERIEADLDINWSKTSDPGQAEILKKMLENFGTYPHSWKDSPDGNLLGAGILLIAWAASQNNSKMQDASPSGKIKHQQINEKLEELTKQVLNIR